jgi:PASTA domain
MTDVETLLRRAMTEHTESLPVPSRLASNALHKATRRTRANRVIAASTAVVLAAAGIAAWTGVGHHDAKKGLVSAAGVVVVPDVTRGYLNDIQRRLCAAGLKPQIVSAPPINHGGSGLNGYGVIKISPPSGASVPAGSVVQLKLGYDVNAGGIEASAPASSLVPKVLGLSVDQALISLVGLDYAVDVTVQTPADGLQIIAQDPEPGVRLAKNQTVTLVAGSAYGGACNPNL